VLSFKNNLEGDLCLADGLSRFPNKLLFLQMNYFHQCLHGDKYVLQKTLIEQTIFSQSFFYARIILKRHSFYINVLRLPTVKN